MAIVTRQTLGQNVPQRRQSPEDGAGGTDALMYGRMNRQIPPVLTGMKVDFVLLVILKDDISSQVVLVVYNTYLD